MPRRVDYNEWQWYVRGADGTHYDPSSYKDPSFDSGTARAGEKVTGYITFAGRVRARSWLFSKKG